MKLVLLLTANGCWIGLNYAVLAVTFGIIYRSSRIFHLAHSAVYAIAAYALTFPETWALPAGASLVVGLATAGLVASAAALFIYRVLYSRLQRRGATTLLVVVVALGLILVVENLLAIIFGNTNVELNYALPLPTLTLGPVTVQSVQVWGAPLLLATVVVLWFAYEKSSLGRLARATGTNTALVESLGFSSQRVIAAAFIISSAALAVPALLIGTTAGVYPTMGEDPVLFAIMAVIFGGPTSYWGWAAGGLLLGLISNLSAFFIGTAWTEGVAFGFVVILMMVFPRGLLGRRSSRYV